MIGTSDEAIACTAGAPMTITRLKRQAFTLIELLVVVAIIALLLAILLPTLSGAREQAKQTYCLTNQKTLAMALVQYGSDNRDALVNSYTNSKNCWVDWPQLPNGTYLSDAQMASQTDTSAEQRGISKGLLYKYAVRVEVYHCPCDRRNVAPRPENGDLAYRTYSLTNFLNGSQSDETYIGGTKIAQRFTQIRRPAESFACIEESDPRGLNMNSWLMMLSVQEWIDPLTVWHQNRGTIGFCDGHAIAHKWQDARTIQTAIDQKFDTDATNNIDWDYLQLRWSRQ